MENVVFKKKIETLEKETAKLLSEKEDLQATKKTLEDEVSQLITDIDEKEDKGTKGLERKVETKKGQIIKLDEKIEKKLNAIEKKQGESIEWRQKSQLFGGILDLSLKQLLYLKEVGVSALTEEYKEIVKGYSLGDKVKSLQDQAEKLFIQRNVSDVLSKANTELSKYFREFIRENSNCIYRKGGYKAIIIGHFLLVNQINPTYLRDYDILYDILSKEDFISIISLDNEKFVEKIERGELSDTEGNMINVDSVVEMFPSIKAEKVQIHILTSEVLKDVVVFDTSLKGEKIDILADRGLSKEIITFLKKSNITQIDEVINQDINDLMKIKYIKEKRAASLLDALTKSLIWSKRRKHSKREPYGAPFAVVKLFKKSWVYKTKCCTRRNFIYSIEKSCNFKIIIPFY